MNLTRMAQEIINVLHDIQERTGRTSDEVDEIYDFDQTWGSTALGFGGMGGQAMTSARTYVVIPDYYDSGDFAYVYFAGRFAYKIKNPNERFREDIRNHRMANVMESGRYKS